MRNAYRIQLKTLPIVGLLCATWNASALSRRARRGGCASSDDRERRRRYEPKAQVADRVLLERDLPFQLGIQEGAKLSATAWVLQFPQCLGFNLPDPLARH